MISRLLPCHHVLHIQISRDQPSSPLRRQRVNVNLVLRTSPQHSNTSQRWFYSVMQQTAQVTDVHHSHFNDKVQLHASHCIIQTLFFTRGTKLHRQRERECGERSHLNINVSCHTCSSKANKATKQRSSPSLLELNSVALDSGGVKGSESTLCL